MYLVALITVSFSASLGILFGLQTVVSGKTVRERATALVFGTLFGAAWWIVLSHAWATR